MANTKRLIVRKKNIITATELVKKFGEVVIVIDSNETIINKNGIVQSASLATKQPGHIFTAEELPEGKKYLVDYLYFEDNPDGTIHVASPEQFPIINGKKIGTYYELEERVKDINSDGYNVRIGGKKDWDSLLKNKFQDKAGLDMSSSYPNDKYWELPDRVLHYDANIRYPRNDITGWLCKNGLARGRIFADIQPFQPMQN